MPPLGHAGSHACAHLLGDAHVDETVSGLAATRRGEANGAGSAGVEESEARIGAHELEHVVGKDCGIVFGRRTGSGLAERGTVGEIEGSVEVESLLVGLGHRQAHALHGVDVHHHGTRGVLHGFESLDEAAEVVAVVDVEIVVAQGAEYIGRAFAVGVAEQAQVGVEGAVVLGDAHVVVVDDYDEVCAEGRTEVETFEGLAATERTVADDGHHILLAALDVASLCQTRGECQCRGGVAD